MIALQIVLYSEVFPGSLKRRLTPYFKSLVTMIPGNLQRGKGDADTNLQQYFESECPKVP